MGVMSLTATEVWAAATRTLTSGTGNTIAFDNARFTMTASQTTDIIPATGETDIGIITTEVAVGGAGDNIRISADSGTNYGTITADTGSTTIGASAGQSGSIQGIGNSTGRYRIVTDGTVGTRTFQRVITTWS